MLINRAHFIIIIIIIKCLRCLNWIIYYIFEIIPVISYRRLNFEIFVHKYLYSAHAHKKWNAFSIYVALKWVKKANKSVHWDLKRSNTDALI